MKLLTDNIIFLDIEMEKFISDNKVMISVLLAIVVVLLFIKFKPKKE